MRTWAAALALLGTPLLSGADKLTIEDRVELMRGLSSEYATVKTLLPRSKKPLPYESNGTYDKSKWEDVAHEFGPAARVGDLVQVTSVMIEADKLVLLINGGFKGGHKWYQNVQIGGGVGGVGNTHPIAQGDSNATAGTTIAILFHKPLEPMKAADVKKMLAPVLDFEKRTATALYAETLPAPVKQAIAEKKAIDGMDRDQVILAMGRPDHKSRETRDGVDYEDWVYGQPPGKIVFVTFSGSKVVKVKEAYAGLGSEVGPQPVPR